MDVKNKIFELVANQTWLDQIGKPLQQAIQQLYESGGPAGRKIADFLHGTWLGHPLHSVLTDVPVGAYTASLALDALEMSTGNRAFGAGADTAIQVGVASAGAAAVAGLTDWQHVSGKPRRIGMMHALLNTAALGLYIASLAARKRGSRETGWWLAMAGYGVVGFSAYLGGHLVYGEKIGVDHAPKLRKMDEFTPVMPEADLQENTLHKVEVKDTPVLLVRREGQIYAMAETCAHLGGPLSKGSLEGDTVKCPWHGSRFYLADGRLAGGPSVYNQPCFETRIRDGQIELRVPPEGHFV